MDSFEKHERMQDARRRLRGQRQRAGRLRGRVVSISLIGFVLLWGVVFAQMATGNDPVLGDKSSVVAGSSTKKHGAKTTDLPVEAAETDPEEGADPGQAAGEAIETTDPEELELRRAAEIEAAEIEAIEVEPEPVTTSQS
jgi:hypothetical protein